MELKKYKLGDIADIIGGVAYQPSDICEEGVRVLRGGNIQSQRIALREDDVFLPNSYANEENQIRVGDTILVASTGSIDVLGKAATCFDEMPNTQIGAFLRIIRPKKECYAMLISMALNSAYFAKYIKAQARGTSINNITVGYLKEFEIYCPENYLPICNIYVALEKKIALNRAINDNLEAMAKQLYDYWFVQFDFPNEEGKPYKSSGGKMIWNDKLKRQIPEGWHCGTLLDIAIYTNGLACQKFRPTDENKLPVIKIKEMHDGISPDTEFVKSDIPEAVKVYDGDVLFSWSASLEVTLWAHGDGGLNQHIFKVTSKNNYPRSFYFYQLIDYIGNFKRMAEARKTTMGHITQDHLKQSTIALPPNADIANKLEERLLPVFDAIITNSQEIMNLTKQRDELLPLLMNGQVSVNYHLSKSYMRQFVYSYYHSLKNTMKQKFIHSVLQELSKVLDSQQLDFVENTLEQKLLDLDIIEQVTNEELVNQENEELLTAFLSAKKIEGCSAKTIKYYKSTINHLFDEIGKTTAEITTNDIRSYLAYYQEQKQSSKVTIDNMRRIFSSFFSWLEDEDYIVKSPVRRIHKVRTDTLVKEVINDECMELLRDNCTEIRDLAMIDLLASTGMRVGELVQMNIDDVDFQERQCKVFGKGNKEREVYFNARAKIHLQQYISQREDDNPALFVSFSSPHKRLSISGVEVRLRTLGRRINLPKIHPHKFRRTLATMAIDKGMPIEQVQRLLGHVKIDTTLHYAMVNQNNVKIAHRRYIG